jgi:site-specific DNA recombinase
MTTSGAKSGAVRRLQCAIYTRKSSEEGLEQDFNSLHAQREACEAYIQSQRHEGWSLVPVAYDDGGYSGGTLERPGIQKLLTDIRAKAVDIVIVYKVDRLTRSLADFARIVETFDQYGASFVSVTQQFNTTTSMGRLTLNVLLSFAQFEREVTGERIRDKIAASKQKGLWMGGNVPLGYAASDRTLVIVPEDADIVRGLFKRYLELQSVPALVRERNAAGDRTQRRLTKGGKPIGGARYFTGALYHLLKNPIYLGEIRHKGKTYPGQHPAIIDAETWNEAQRLLKAGSRRSSTGVASQATLSGKVYDSAGRRMTPTHSKKADGRHYRYYVSRMDKSDPSVRGKGITRISAELIERLVDDAIRPHTDSAGLDQVERVVIHRAEVRVFLDQASMPLVIPYLTARRGNQIQVRSVSNDGSVTRVPDRALLHALVKAHRWRQQLMTGQYSMAKLTSEAQTSRGYVNSILPLAFLAPDLVEALLDGRQSMKLSLSALKAAPLPLAWAEQRARLA